MTTTTNKIDTKDLILIEEGKVFTEDQADLIIESIMAQHQEDEKEELKNDVEELYNLEKEAKEAYKANNNTPNKEKETALYNGKVDFLNKYGSEKLCIFNMYSSLESKIDYVVYEKGTLKRHKNNKRNNQTREY